MNIRAWTTWLAVVLAVCAFLPLPAGGSTRYDGDGQLSGVLEAQRWWLNRVRFAPELEADRQGLTNQATGGTPHYDICEDSVGSGAFGPGPASWSFYRLSRQPLASNARMITAAQKHAQDMLASNLLTSVSPSSNYYPKNSTMMQRHALEGYTNQLTGYIFNFANLSGGAFNMATLQNLWFRDVGVPARPNRQGIINALSREVGIGFATSNVTRYIEQDFGFTGSNVFFTCSLFLNTNANVIYDNGEGVVGVEVRLWQGGLEAPWFDVSGSAGGFAVPLWGLATGDLVFVTLVNTSAVPVTLDLAYDFGSVGRVTLTSGQSRIIGTFDHRAADRNVGLRNVVPWTKPSAIAVESNRVHVTFAGWQNLPYRAELLDVLTSTQWVNFANGTATGEYFTVTDAESRIQPGPESSSMRLYRVWFQRDYE